MKHVHIRFVSRSDSDSLISDLNQTLDSITSRSDSTFSQDDAHMRSSVDLNRSTFSDISSMRDSNKMSSDVSVDWTSHSPHNMTHHSQSHHAKTLVKTTVSPSPHSPSMNQSKASHRPITVNQLPFRVVRATASFQTHSPHNIICQSTQEWWASGLGDNHELVLSLTKPALLGNLILANRNLRQCQIFVSLVDKPDQYILMFDGRVNPHRVSTINCGYLPCRFVKVRCLTAESSIYFVRLSGVLLVNQDGSISDAHIGADRWQLLVERPLSACTHVPPQLNQAIRHGWPDVRSKHTQAVHQR